MSDERSTQDVKLTFYTAWCEAHNCTHGHCSLGCEHPQPGRYAGDDRLICGVCYFHDGTISEIEPCMPATCRDALPPA